MLYAKKVFDVEVHLDGGQKMEVRYLSEYVSQNVQINKILNCVFDGKDITAVFGRKSENIQSTDLPTQVWMAVDHNAKTSWFDIMNKRVTA